MSEKREGILTGPLKEIKYVKGVRPYEGPLLDERRNEPTAEMAHKWAEENNLYIKNPFWGSGYVIGENGLCVEEESLPDFVKKHIEFRMPDDEED